MKNVSNWISCRCFKSGLLKRYKVITINMRKNTDHENELVWTRDTFWIGLASSISRGSLMIEKAQKRDFFWNRWTRNKLGQRDQFLMSLQWHYVLKWQTQYAMKDYYRHNYLMEITRIVFMFSLRAGALRTYIFMFRNTLLQ